MLKPGINVTFAPMSVPSPTLPTTLTLPSSRSGVSVNTKPYLMLTFDPIFAFAEMVHLLPNVVPLPMVTLSLISQ